MNAAEKVIEHAPLAPVQNGHALTPMDMLDRAVAGGSSVEVLERLMALQERWDAAQARKAFNAAIALAKADIKPITRDRAGHNAKKYVSFDAIARAVDPVLSRHGLMYRFRSEQTDNRISVTCILSHGAHHEETTLSGPADTSGSKNAIQAIGSTLTYLQRYSLVQMLGLAAADDDDGRGSSGGNGNGVLTDEQAETIRNLVTDTKSNVNLFLAWIGAPSISDIPQARFERARQMLERKKAEAAKAKQEAKQ